MIKNGLKVLYLLLSFVAVIANAKNCAEQELEHAKKQLLLTFNGFLFSIQKGHNESFLLGTVHGGYSTQQKLGGNILSILNCSDKIYLEAVLNEANLALLSELSTKKNGAKLHELIEENYFNFFDDLFVRKWKLLTEKEYINSQPWYIAMMIPFADPRTDKTLKWDLATEAQLMLKAKEKHIVVEELEGLQAQSKIFNAMSDQLQTEYFRDYVNLIQNRTIYQWQIQGVDAWSKGDMKMLNDNFYEFVNLKNAYSTFYANELIKKRNVALSKKISAITQKGNHQLFAIGSDHLIGDDGIIQQLKNQGFIVRRLN